MHITHLHDKSTSQDTHGLVDICLPNTRTLTHGFLALLSNRKTKTQRERNVLVRKVGGVDLKSLLPCPQIFRRCVRVIDPLLKIFWLAWQRHLHRNRCWSGSSD